MFYKFLYPSLIAPAFSYGPSHRYFNILIWNMHILCCKTWSFSLPFYQHQGDEKYTKLPSQGSNMDLALDMVTTRDKIIR